MKSSALKLFFQAERDTCNQLVASVRHQSPLLDTNDFNWFITNCLDPLMCHLDKQSNQATFPVAHAGFIHGLELASLNWLKSDVKKDVILKTWNQFYPEILPIIDVAPHKVFAETSNVFSHLLGFGHERPLKWLALMSSILSELDSRDSLKKAGFVCAWLAGLAHLRGPALAQIETLAEPVVRALFGLSNAHDLKRHLAELKNNRWYKGLRFQGNADDSSPNVEKRIGNCNLLGGEFPLPPQAFAAGGQLFITSGKLAWRLYADAYGATLVPFDPGELAEISAEPVARKSFSDFSHLTALNDISDISSVAHLNDTIALTSDETFAVIILSASTAARELTEY